MTTDSKLSMNPKYNVPALKENAYLAFAPAEYTSNVSNNILPEFCILIPQWNIMFTLANRFQEVTANGSVLKEKLAGR